MAKVYVGTYKKYNEGNLSGQWIDLDKINTYGDFLAKCAEIHKDEKGIDWKIEGRRGERQFLRAIGLKFLIRKEYRDLDE